MAAGADRGRGARPGARPVAGGTGSGHRHGDRDLRALHRLVERDVDLGLQVTATLGPVRPAATRGSTGPEQVGQDVADPPEPAAARAGPEGARIEAAEDPAAGVVSLALLRVGQDVVGLLDLLEALLGRLVTGVAVGVVLARELPVGLLDLVRRGLLVDPEDLVRVLDRGHG